MFSEEYKPTQKPIERVQEVVPEGALTPEQELLWRPPTDEEVKRISASVHVNVLAGTAVRSPDTISWNYTESQEENKNYKSWKTLVSESGTPVLIDLGSSTRVADTQETTLPNIGITKYIGVDLAANVQNTEFKKGDLDVRYIHGEALQVLHSLPDNSGNLWMVGLEEENVISGKLGDWTMAILREMKRVVPKNGFMVTDGLVLDHAIKKLSDTPLLKEHTFIDERTANPEDFRQYFIPDGEKIRGFVFAFNEPNLGLKIYTDTNPARYLGDIVLIINTRK